MLALTLPVMNASLVRSLNVVGGPTLSSSTTEATLSIRATVCSAVVLSASVASEHYASGSERGVRFIDETD
jgi:hypothetical protein